MGTFRLPRKRKKQYKKDDPLFSAHWNMKGWKELGVPQYRECCYKWFYKKK